VCDRCIAGDIEPIDCPDPCTIDPCVVESEPLRGMLNEFVDRWNLTRTATRTGTSFRSAVDRVAAPTTADVRARAQLGALAWLSQQTGVPVSTIQNIARPRRPKYRTTELRVADPLVAAMNRPEAFQDRTLEVTPNPRAPANVRARCCGGSE
jgi:hypothetical protein